MVNRKQFVISRNSYKYEGFETVQLQDGYILSYQSDLKIYDSKGKKQGIIIGLAWQSDPDRKIPSEELDYLLMKDGKVELSDIYEMEKSWCGRYILIVENTVILDAAGLLGVFYHDDALSSSYAVLCDMVGIKNKYPDKTFGIGMGYQPGTKTMHESIKRLIPSQSYDYIEHKLFYRELFPMQDVLEEGKDQLLKRFIRYFESSLKNMCQVVNGEIWLALTGGHDSRALMALLESAGISYKCFTLEVDNISNADKELPGKLAKLMGRQFFFIGRNYSNFSSKRMKEYISHSNGFAKDQDAVSYSFGQYQKLSDRCEDVVILRGGLWEIAVGYFRRFADNDGKLSLEKVKKSYEALNHDDRAIQSLLKYLNYIKSNEEKSIDEVDRFYWEIRGGCWLSSIEQSCDIMDGITFLQPCNSRILLTLLIQLAHTEIEPWKKHHQEDVIRECCNELLNINFDSAYEIKPVKRTLREKVCIKIYINLTRLYLYGFRGIVIMKKIFWKKYVKCD